MRAAAFVLVALAAGCEYFGKIGETPDGGGANEIWTELRLGIRTDDVDILFMVDNSPSMAPKQHELGNRVATLFKALDDNAQLGFKAHYHVGVVTSDLGAGPITLLGAQCHPGGDGGRLQALGAAAPPGCLAPTGGLPFIDLDQVAVRDNLPAGQDLATTFRCLAAVGDTGCGFEQPLESVYQALVHPAPEDHDFLRPGALLAIVFVTDEDDCSAPPDTDLFDPAKVGTYGAELSFRCTQFGLVCGSPPTAPPYGLSNGALPFCQSAPNPNGAGPGKLYDLQRYTDLFRKPRYAGGLKDFPSDIFLFAIDGPSAPVSVLDANLTAPAGPYQPCNGPVDGVNCATVLQHSCVAQNDTAFFGDPAVRLNQVVSATLPSGVHSICDTDFASTMQTLAATVISYQAGNGCLPGPVPDPNDARCQVADELPDGTSQRLPSCASNGGAPPCWAIDPLGDCAPVFNCRTNQYEHLQLRVERGDTPAPAGSTARASCVVVTGGC